MMRSDMKDHQWLNSIQDELTNVIEASEKKLDAKNDQLLASVLDQLSRETLEPEEIDPLTFEGPFNLNYGFIQSGSEVKIYTYRLSNKND